MSSQKTVVTQAPPAVAPTEAEISFFDQQSGPFFRRFDWAAFWVAFLVAFGVYFYTMAPTVTLEDSGELAVASDYLGVPHPPGYPIWSLVTWFFQWIFHWVKYYGQPDSNLELVFRSIADLFNPSIKGHPNPAWSVGMCSAFFGALASGLLALLVSRSGSDMIRSLKKETALLGFKTESLFCWVSGVTGGLLFAFSPVLWSQSTIVEVYSLNAFFMALVLLLIYRWMCRPKEDSTLYVTAFVFGLGLTNHQTLLFLGPAILVATWYRDREFFRDCCAALFLVVALYLFNKAWHIAPGSALAKSKSMYIGVGVILCCAPVGLYFIENRIFTTWKRLVISASLAILGLSFYAGYMPVSSEQNPPINWGYPRTMEGFRHAVSRGQYERIDPVANLQQAISDPAYFGKLSHILITDHQGYISVVAQFGWHISLAVLALLFMAFRLDKKSRDWLVVSLMAFVWLTLVFIIFQWPKPDVQTLFIGRVQYIQAHAIFAMWIAYGFFFGLVYLETLLRGNRFVKIAGCLGVLALPIVPIWTNAYDEEYIKMVGGAEQNEHDFGWQFGAWQLEGARAILAEISEEEKKTYPNPNYPPPMDTNAVFFGGTDPGRFVPTYMIYSAHYREDVYLITQNALADNTYMNVMRDLYGDRIWIPSQQDSNFAFQKYVQDVQSGRIPAGADVSFEGGRVSVQGVQGVMMINGILARMIFEANKKDHPFYVEESYVIPWMYPYLEPHGLIMKINSEPINITPEIVKNDTDFWDWYTKRLTANPKFHRDVVARKTFSKLRSAIAGLYAARRMFTEAEHAFRQAIDLYPLSPEANFRLADIFMQQFRFADARSLIEEFLVEDPDNDKVEEFLNQIKGLETADTRRRELEKLLQQGGDINSALELCNIYRQMNLQQLFDGLAMNIINQTNLPPTIVLQLGQMYAESRRFDMLAMTLERYLQREPGNLKVWVDLAAVLANIQKTNEALSALRKAVEMGGDPVRDIARKDGRFDPIRQMPEFKALIPDQVEAGMNMPLNLPGFQGF